MHLLVPQLLRHFNAERNLFEARSLKKLTWKCLRSSSCSSVRTSADRCWNLAKFSASLCSDFSFFSCHCCVVSNFFLATYFYKQRVIRNKLTRVPTDIKHLAVVANANTYLNIVLTLFAFPIQLGLVRRITQMVLLRLVLSQLYLSVLLVACF